MPSSLIPSISPEREELEEKQRQLGALSEELAQRELDLATLTHELERFRRVYVRIVGSRYAELDALGARLAAIRARLDPDNAAMAAQAQAAHERAERTRAEADVAGPEVAVPKFDPSPDLKALYRDAAKRLHPDLAPDDVSRARRTALMAEVNRAYAAGDRNALQGVLQSWEFDPANMSESGVGGDFVRVIRQITAVKARIATTVAEIASLAAGDVGTLYRRYREAEAAGRNLLEEMALRLEDDIAARRRELVDWQIREAAE